MIELYTWPAPNGQKVQILLEELAVDFKVIPIDITAGHQHSETYRALNPNRKIPTIVDHDPDDHSEPITIFETGAIMLYLAEKYGQFLPQDLRGRNEVIQWLFWQVGGLGPVMGQAQHFYGYAPRKIPYAIVRYQSETERLVTLLEERLSRSDYICSSYSIADMACYPWLRINKLVGLSLESFPHVQEWYSRLHARPSVARGINILRDRWVNVAKSDDAKRNLFRKD